LRFYATHQPPEVTAERIADGTCFVLEEDARLIGTITVYAAYAAYAESEVPCYREPGTFHFGQFGVEPECKGRGAVERERKVLVSFPAGIETGQRLRVPGQGMPGPRGTPPRPAGSSLRRRDPAAAVPRDRGIT
jgi:hypothetical protein